MVGIRWSAQECHRWLLPMLGMRPVNRELGIRAPRDEINKTPTSNARTETAPDHLLPWISMPTIPLNAAYTKEKSLVIKKKKKKNYSGLVMSLCRSALDLMHTLLRWFAVVIKAKRQLSRHLKCPQNGSFAYGVTVLATAWRRETKKKKKIEIKQLKI